MTVSKGIEEDRGGALPFHHLAMHSFGALEIRGQKGGDGDWRLLIAFRAHPERLIIASQTTKGQLIDVGDEGTSSSIE